MEGYYLTNEIEPCCLKLSDYTLVVSLGPRGVQDHKVDGANLRAASIRFSPETSFHGEDHPLDGLLVRHIRELGSGVVLT